MNKYEQFKQALWLAILAPTDAQEQKAVAPPLQVLPWLSVRQEKQAKAEVLARLNKAISVELDDGSGWQMNAEEQARWDMCNVGTTTGRSKAQ